MMNYKKLHEQFAGKVCTILTSGIAKNNFGDQQFADFFTGIVDSIEQDGIYTRHPLTGYKNFYVMSHVIGIIEEQFIAEDDPQYEKVIEEMKNSSQKSSGIMEVDPNNSPFIDPIALASLQKQAQDFNRKMVSKNQP